MSTDPLALWVPHSKEIQVTVFSKLDTCSPSHLAGGRPRALPGSGTALSQCPGIVQARKKEPGVSLLGSPIWADSRHSKVPAGKPFGVRPALSWKPSRVIASSVCLWSKNISESRLRSGPQSPELPSTQPRLADDISKHGPEDTLAMSMIITMTKTFSRTMMMTNYVDNC